MGIPPGTHNPAGLSLYSLTITPPFSAVYVAPMSALPNGIQNVYGVLFADTFVLYVQNGTAPILIGGLVFRVVVIL